VQLELLVHKALLELMVLLVLLALKDPPDPLVQLELLVL
jgi:hypothetical protein